MTKYFGGDLYVVDEEDLIFPSLAQLRGKIVVKTSSKEEELRNLQVKAKLSMLPEAPRAYAEKL